MNGKNIPLQPNEEIKPIQGYEGLYSITNFGRVWSHEKIRKFGLGWKKLEEKFLKLNKDSDSYLLVNLYIDRRGKTFKIARLTAQHFIPNPQNFPQVNHKDGNKQNNFAGTKEKNYEDSNLEWCTDQDNHNHAMKNGLTYKRHSKFYGVSFCYGIQNKNKPWFSYVRVDKKKICLGYFKTEIEAAQTYNKYVIEHGLNRLLNKIKV